MSDVQDALEDLLAAQAAQGREVDEGVFTLSPEQMLAKLAEFQLPFKGAWVLKLVQAAVVSGCSSLEIHSTSEETSFRFAPHPGWKLDEVEDAIWYPQRRPAPGLRHLAVALWSVGMGGRRDFSLDLAGQTEVLQWTSGQLKRVSRPAPARTTFLSVRHLPNDATALSSLVTRVATAFENAEVLTVIRDRCFTCPIHLTLDGRRMDSLQLSPRHGWSNQTDLLCLAVFQDKTLPPLPLSPYSFTLHPASRPGGSAVEALELPENPPPSCPLAVLVTVNVQLGAKGAHLYKKGRSALYWVLDGVVIEACPWLKEESFCSLGCVLSAEGIATDLSTLALQQDPALQERSRRAAELCLRLLKENDWEVLNTWAEEASTSEQKVAKVFAGVGVVTLPVLPVGLALLGIGVLCYALAGANQLSARKAITADLPGLISQLKAELD